MPRESYAAAVVRHVQVLEELYTELLNTLPPEEQKQRLKEWLASSNEIDRLSKQRIDASEYEFQRRQGKQLGETVRVVRPRRG